MENLKPVSEKTVRPDQCIVFEDVSKFYGEILGVNRVSIEIAPGITSLVGPNGSGKTTLMNLMTGLIRPTSGHLSVVGLSPSKPEEFFRRVGYCSQFDSFPAGHTGYEFVYSFLRVHGYGKREADQLTGEALEMVNLTDASGRKVAGYSKGMRQRIRLAQAIAHKPDVIVLDEPLNGLDPVARNEAMRLFRTLADRGQHLIISSHILHEVNTMSDRVVFIESGYIKAAGQVSAVREELEEHPLQILVQCDRPSWLAQKLFEEARVVEARVLPRRNGLLVKTSELDPFYDLVQKLVVNDGLVVENVATTDDNLDAVYQYLITGRKEGE